MIVRSGGLGGCVKSWSLIIVAHCGGGLSPGLEFQWDVVGELNQ